MPRETNASRLLRCEQIYQLLAHTYPGVRCELNFQTPLELLIATILSAQCTDRQVNIVTVALFEKYKCVDDYANCRVEDLENDIRRIGLYRSKAKNIRAACRDLVANHDGRIPKTLEHLVALPGVGRKTANVVLGNAFGINVGVVVDTHVGRLSQRLGLTSHSDPVKVERDLMNLVPQVKWAIFSHLLIWHGRRRCQARNPDCEQCEILQLCPTGKKRRQLNS